MSGRDRRSLVKEMEMGDSDLRWLMVDGQQPIVGFQCLSAELARESQPFLVDVGYDDARAALFGDFENRQPDRSGAEHQAILALSHLAASAGMNPDGQRLGEGGSDGVESRGHSVNIRLRR